ncbi:diheme cytochrome c [Accumulibacter sp.]|uniref:diheme cytochrome c n=1 Tax=Accumulibacter sp. TaxID=2053492 RepID=UPI0025E9CA34|nr:diheme cytochrome c [Accumulibacter sp.]MCM8596998.1 diheme cytochrome c [Accumulibacter sp.]MCM8626256.1 diheme cytochrome c [Accumulibacter sp.]MDS4051147.1 diheme cytochrome c [Accumulibacter sp.]
MRIAYRPIVLGLLAAGFSILLLQRALAGGGHYFPPVGDPLVNEECGSCHLAYPPSMLPAASWRRLIGDLRNHFGDDASVDAPTAARITDYLTANAADSGGRRYGEKMLRGLAPGEAPLRITELPRWIREHRKVPDRDWRHKDVRTRANCPACHVDAQRGYFDE